MNLADACTQRVSARVPFGALRRGCRLPVLSGAPLCSGSDIYSLCRLFSSETFKLTRPSDWTNAREGYLLNTLKLTLNTRSEAHDLYGSTDL